MTLERTTDRTRCRSQPTAQGLNMTLERSTDRTRWRSQPTAQCLNMTLGRTTDRTRCRSQPTAQGPRKPRPKTRLKHACPITSLHSFNSVIYGLRPCDLFDCYTGWLLLTNCSGAIFPEPCPFVHGADRRVVAALTPATTCRSPRTIRYMPR